MWYRYFTDFQQGTSVFATFSYGIAILGTFQCPRPYQLLREWGKETDDISD